MSAGRTHPPIGVWSIGLAGDLRRAMVEDGMRKIDAWTARHGIVHVDWPAEPIDPFFNANRPDDLAAAAEMLARG
jgi:molybdopterin-guanine dinucleotide biosynthesis protein A